MYTSIVHHVVSGNRSCHSIRTESVINNRVVLLEGLVDTLSN